MKRHYHKLRHHSRGQRRGLTLIELMVAALVMSLVAVVLGGLVTAVDTARKHIEGLQSATASGRLAIDRVRDAVNRAGVYRIGSGETVPGLRVMTTGERSDVLVVWTGGRETNFAEQGLIARRPKASELLIFTPDPDAAHRLVELAVPGNDSEVDFEASASQFATRVTGLINSVAAEKILLCDRMRVGDDGSQLVAAMRFECEAVPSGPQINGTPTNSAGWRDLAWMNGASTGTSGLRQLLVRIEFQIVTLEAGNANVASIPLFGAAERRYQHIK